MIEWLVLGVVLGVAFIAYAARSPSPDRVMAWGLAIAAVIYLFFAVPHGIRWLGVEALGVAIFVSLAYLGLRRPGLLVFGWMAHAGWDAGLHLLLDQPVVGDWYPLACLGFDVVVAGWFAWHVAPRGSISNGVPT